jgi:hypothetical protein
VRKLNRVKAGVSTTSQGAVFLPAQAPHRPDNRQNAAGFPL